MTRTALRHPLTAKQPLLFVGVVLVPALLCSVLVWKYLSDWWQLSAVFWYSIPGNSFLWLPHEPAVIYAGALYAPALVAVVGGLATSIASVVDHTLFTRAFRSSALAPVKEARAMRVVVKYFNRYPWWTTVVAPSLRSPFILFASSRPWPTTPWAGMYPRWWLDACHGTSCSRWGEAGRGSSP